MDAVIGVVAGAVGCCLGSVCEDSCRGRTVRHALELTCYGCHSDKPDRVCVQCESRAYCDECFHMYHHDDGYRADHYRFFFIGKKAVHGGEYPEYPHEECVLVATKKTA